MSDAPRESREWRFNIGDMLKFGETVLAYTEGLDQEAFVADTRTYAATLRNIELIGEAATHIPADVREAHLAVPWHAIIGARNRPGSQLSPNWGQRDLVHRRGRNSDPATRAEETAER